MTYLSLPNIGAKPIITPANADFTCMFGSITRSCKNKKNIQRNEMQSGNFYLSINYGLETEFIYNLSITFFNI